MNVYKRPSSSDESYQQLPDIKYVFTLFMFIIFIFIVRISFLLHDFSKFDRDILCAE